MASNGFALIMTRLVTVHTHDQSGYQRTTRRYVFRPRVHCLIIALIFHAALMTVCIAAFTHAAVASLEDEEFSVVNDTRSRIGEQVSSSIIDGLRELHGFEKCSIDWVGLLAEGSVGTPFVAQLLVKDECVDLIPELLALRSEESAAVRREVIWVVGEIGTKDMAGIVARSIFDKSARVGAQAVRSTCNLDHERCLALLPELSTDGPNADVRAQAILLSGKLGTRFEKEQVVSILKDGASSVVNSMLTEINCELLADAETRSRVISMVRSNELWLAATTALGRCGIREAGPSLLKLYGERIDHELSDGMSTLMRALAACDANAARWELQKYISEHPSVPEMQEIGASNDVTPLETAVGLIGEIGGMGSVDVLREVLNDPYYRVRLAAIGALEALGLKCALRSELEHLAIKDVQIVRTAAERATRGCHP